MLLTLWPPSCIENCCNTSRPMGGDKRGERSMILIEEEMNASLKTRSRAELVLMLSKKNLARWERNFPALGSMGKDSARTPKIFCHNERTYQ